MLHFIHLKFKHPNEFNHPQEPRGKSQVLSEDETPDPNVLLSQIR